jgi:predicted transcriptional regulator
MSTSGLLTPADIESRAKAAGVTIGALCKTASVDRSTFTRWKQGTSDPKLSVYTRFLAAVEALPIPKSGVTRADAAP